MAQHMDLYSPSTDIMSLEAKIGDNMAAILHAWCWLNGSDGGLGILGS